MRMLARRARSSSGCAPACAPAERRGSILHERAGEGLVLVERRAAERAVLLERELELGALGQLALEVRERAQAEAAQDLVEVRRAHKQVTLCYLLGGSPP